MAQNADGRIAVVMVLDPDFARQKLAATLPE
jgi:hypothetical protein